MSLSPYLVQQYLAYIEKLLKYSITKFFLEPFSLSDDSSMSKVHNNIGLNNVIRKLENNGYEDGSGVLYDVNLIWDNACILYSQNSAMYQMAQQLRRWTGEIFIVRENEDFSFWRLKFSYYKQQLYNLIKGSSKTSKKEGSQQTSETNSKKKTTKKPPKEKVIKWDNEKRAALADLVNSLQDEKIILEVIQLIKDKEPSLNVLETEPLEVSLLQKTTLSTLSEFLKSKLGETSDQSVVE